MGKKTIICLEKILHQEKDRIIYGIYVHFHMYVCMFCLLVSQYKFKNLCMLKCGDGRNQYRMKRMKKTTGRCTAHGMAGSDGGDRVGKVQMSSRAKLGGVRAKIVSLEF